MDEERELRWCEWMRAAQSGDSACYEKLLLELLPHLRRFVGRRLADAASVEDVVQNAFASLHRARHTWRAERPLSPWVYAIARNAVVDFERARGRRARREISLDAEGVPEPVAEEATPADPALAPELRRALASLPPAQREAVVLLHLEGLSVAEAAARAGVSKTALKVRAHRGARRMRGLLSALEAQEGPVGPGGGAS